MATLSNQLDDNSSVQNLDYKIELPNISKQTDFSGNLSDYIDIIDYLNYGTTGDISEFNKLTHNFGYDDTTYQKLNNSSNKFISAQNRYHIIKLENSTPNIETAYSEGFDYSKSPTTFVDLCRKEMTQGIAEYIPENFLYCRNLGFPINKLITLRRFPLPCTDNIWDLNVQKEPDIARMVTYSSEEQNKLSDLLTFSYRMNWKELQAEMERYEIYGDQSGFSGEIGKFMKFFDKTAANNQLISGNNLDYDPKHDQNKVYGPVDSIIKTNIRDVGLDFEKEFEIIFEYDLRAINGGTPEYAFKDLLSNILACTFNDGNFWGGSRYWVGQRPSPMMDKLRSLDAAGGVDGLWGNNGFFAKAYNELSAAVSTAAANYSKNGGSSSLEALKKLFNNSLSSALGNILNVVGRPSIVYTDSLLSGSPVGNWHLTIGNPLNPIMCIGNLILTDTEISFPSEALSYGDFPTKMDVKVRLKPAMPKDKAGIELMFNMGKSRIYHSATKVRQTGDKNDTYGINSIIKNIDNVDARAIRETMTQSTKYLKTNEIPQVIKGNNTNGNSTINQFGNSSSDDKTSTDNYSVGNQSNVLPDGSTITETSQTSDGKVISKTVTDQFNGETQTVNTNNNSSIDTNIINNSTNSLFKQFGTNPDSPSYWTFMTNGLDNNPFSFNEFITMNNDESLQGIASQLNSVTSNNLSSASVSTYYSDLINQFNSGLFNLFGH